MTSPLLEAIITMDGASTTLLFVVWIVLPITSFVWKRQMIKGGSYIAKLVKVEALKRKKRNRRRLGDILKDDLLRKQMIRQFQTKLTAQQCEDRIRELEIQAAQEVTADDIHISTDNILEAVMSRIWLGLGIWMLLLNFVWSSLFIVHIVVGLIWVAIHELDNKVNFGKFEIMSCCGTKPVLFDGEDDDDDEGLLRV